MIALSRCLEAVIKSKRVVDEEEFSRLNSPTRRTVIHERFLDGELQGCINPKKYCLQTPKAKNLKHVAGVPVSWNDYIEAFKGQGMEGMPWVILGAGASALSQPLELLDDHVIYGINWTLEWFPPTFLQIVDDIPYDRQIKKNTCWQGQAIRTQFVTSKHMALRRCGHGKKNILKFDIHHPAIKSKSGGTYYAETPEDKMSWAKNSLVYALNVAAWFRPKKILLIGFDFKGSHFFGDGASKGSQGDFGLDDKSRNDTVHKINHMRDAVIENTGAKIIQVGPCAEDLFNRVDTLEEALDA